MSADTGTPLTILQMTTSGNLSGGTRQVLLLCEGLCDRGHRVLFAGTEGTPVLSWARAGGFETFPLEFKGIPQQWRTSRRLRRLARKEGVQVVHAHHTHAHNLALLATLGRGFPPIVANRGVVFRPHFAYKFRSRLTSAVITNSEAAKAVLVAAKVPAGKIHVVYNAKLAPDLTDLSSRLDELRRELSIGEDAVVVGAVGSAKPSKGFQHLVAAAPRILESFPVAVFVLVGSGTPNLLPAVEALGLEARFRLPGPRTDVTTFLGLFDVFVLPSLSESCPNVLIEAQGVGVPAVCSDVGGVPELLEGGHLGRLVPPADSAALAAAVCAALSSPEASRATAEEARAAALARFTVGNKIDGTVRVYRSLLSGHADGETKR